MPSSVSAMDKSSDPKRKSYRNADTEMRAYIDAQQEAVTAKIDEIKKSLRDDIPKKRQPAPPLVADDAESDYTTAKADIGLHDLKPVCVTVDSAANKRIRTILFIAALLALALGGYQIFRQQNTVKAAPEAAASHEEIPAPTDFILSPLPSAKETEIAVVTPIPQATPKAVATEKPAPTKKPQPKKAPAPLRFTETL